MRLRLLTGLNAFILIDMEQLVEHFKDIMLIFTLGLPRIIGAMSVLSFMSAQLLGGAMARNGIAIVLGLVIYPLLEQDILGAQLTVPLIVGIAIKELLIGMLLGYLVTVVFWAIQGVGFFIDNQRGASMASSMDPLVGSQSSPLGLFMSQTLVTLFFVSGLFFVFLDGIYTSYTFWPVTSFFPSISAELADFVVKQFILVTKLTVIVGGPIIIVMFLSEFGLGLIGRFAPQLNVFFLSMPIKSGLANFMLVVFWAVLIAYFGDLLGDNKDRVHELRRILQ